VRTKSHKQSNLSAGGLEKRRDSGFDDLADEYLMVGFKVEVTHNLAVKRSHTPGQNWRTRPHRFDDKRIERVFELGPTLGEKLAQHKFLGRINLTDRKRMAVADQRLNRVPLPGGNRDQSRLQAALLDR
jgi:hypothetical protein